MNKGLYLKLFGNPAIFLNGEEIFFSFSKVNALLYYLLLQKNVSRDEIAGILWENKNTQISKKNLRNTIYQANKFLGDEYIICPSRSLLSLNPHLPISSDVEQFLANPEQTLGLYQGRFLKDFYLKNSEAFDFWIEKMRSYYEQIYIKTCHDKMKYQLTKNDVEETEQHILRLIEIDEFDEANYQLLMRLYQENNQAGKVIKTYYKLANLLDEELGIAPSQEVQQIYDEVVAQGRNERKIKQFLRNTTHFYGRVQEISQLEAYFSDVIKQEDVRTLVLLGGSGIGKRTVTRQVLANQTQQFQIVTAECLNSDRSLRLQPWRSLLNGLKDLLIHHQIMSIQAWEMLCKREFPFLSGGYAQDRLDMNALSLAMSTILQQIAQKKPLVLLIEDCHWMDTDSITLLQHLLNHMRGCPIALVLTKHLHATPHLDSLFNQLILQQQVKFIELQPFDSEQSQAFFQMLVGSHSVSSQQLEQIFQISQGNPFLLEEYAEQVKRGEKFEALTPAIRAKMQLKLSYLSSREEELLHYLTCFQKPVSLQLLAQLLVLPFDEIIEMSENLCQQRILSEINGKEEILVYFHQTILKIYCYDSLSHGKKRLLHGQIAHYLEGVWEKNKQDTELLHTISYHYKEAKQLIQSLRYSLYYLDTSLQFHHELFPIYTPQSIADHYSSPEDTLNIQDTFTQLEDIIHSLEHQHGHQREFQQLLNHFRYLEGRFDIRTGHYEKGIKNILSVIDSAHALHQHEFLLEGYRQIIHYCIQVENLSEMKFYTDLALDTAVTANNHEAIATHLRLKGLYHLMMGEESQAIRLLKQSIDCFSLTASLRHKYAIQIGAALDYLAEIEQIRGNLDQSITYQMQAIQLTQQISPESSNTIFYIGLGISYYHLGDLTEADRIFSKIEAMTKSQLYPWKAVQLDVYLALIHCQKGDYSLAQQILLNKEQLMSRYSTPRDKGMVYYLMSLLKYQIIAGKLTNSELIDLLSQDFGTYFGIAKHHLNSYRDRRLLSDLEEWKQALQTPAFKEG
ncbi:AAA family ATPase [Streptococcus sp. zg-86]|uniref:AAA family ATPase n=1 Tax=Streptococcus zhangguiae TaxID=2664091 RepID=A0A6I4RKF9_9STRE|nr:MULTISPECIES: AAA family ATPase [unclassified Streptococcus]MTB64954.1 AAA family ATPase [Streptococcus sp. zg-86]MTB91168.1 AAA family ATPase [Streptococcus sp. zg-36]MWV56961.1 AAA family ATPase [Streptococcus sp. zg-70]QTH47199.1 AAA family ATPase [Streptococcus sp. zg-86]